MEEIEVVIDKDGKVHLDVKGATGPRCLDITRPLEDALGEVEARDFAPEYYATTETEGRIDEQQR